MSGVGNHSDFLKGCTFTASKEDLDLVFKLWPENFLGLYDMGFRSFERLFNHRPRLKTFMQLAADESWKNDEKMKKIVLALEQTLVKAIATFAEPDSDPENTPEAFAIHLQEVGGLHRGIVPSLSPDNFELLFKLLPEVIADVTSSRRTEGPLTPDERTRLLAVWTSIGTLMSRHFVLGWERRVVPKNPKFSAIYRSEKRAEDQRRSSTEVAGSAGNRTRAASDATGAGSTQRRTPSRHGPHRSRTQVEITAATPWLERGNSAPIALHDLQLEFQQLSSS